MKNVDVSVENVCDRQVNALRCLFEGMHGGFPQGVYWIFRNMTEQCIRDLGLGDMVATFDYCQYDNPNDFMRDNGSARKVRESIIVWAKSSAILRSDNFSDEHRTP